MSQKLEKRARKMYRGTIRQYSESKVGAAVRGLEREVAGWRIVAISAVLVVVGLGLCLLAVSL